MGRRGQRAEEPLFLNTVRWLAEPSHKARTLGGYAEPSEKPDYRPKHLRPIPVDWAEMAFREPRHQDYAVLVGMRSSLSGGPAAPDAMLAAAQAAGYAIAVFAEPVASMDAAKWQALLKACERATT